MQKLGIVNRIMTQDTSFVAPLILKTTKFLLKIVDFVNLHSKIIPQDGSCIPCKCWLLSTAAQLPNDSVYGYVIELAFIKFYKFSYIVIWYTYFATFSLHDAKKILFHLPN